MRTDAIRLARVPARLAGRPGLRETLSRWLADSDLARHGLPRQAIVLVRYLSAPWTHIAAEGGEPRHRELAAALAQAVRATSGASSATAVWFADEAEVLTCLAQDAIAGTLHLRWWWRVLLRGTAGPMLAISRWLQAPRVVPRALARLDRDSALAWLASWDEGAQASLLRELEHAFPIAPAVRTYVLAGALPGEPAVPCANTGQPPIGPLARVPATTCSASSRAERLWQLCAALGTDAAAACEAHAAQRLAARLGQAAAGTPLPRLVRPASPPTPEARRTSRRDAAPVPIESPPPGTAPAPRRSGDPEEPTRRASSPAVLAGPTLQDPARTPLIHTSQPWLPQPYHDQQPPNPQAASTMVCAVPHAAFDTCHGGLLFLLNAALQLGLYGDFTQPMQRGLSCSPWRFLRCAGLAFCGAGFRSDPLSDWLARRDPRPAARCRPAARDRHMPAPWLSAFPPTAAPWHATWSGGRLSLRHPAGFVVMETDAAPAQCEALLASEWTRLGIAPQPLQRAVVSRRGSAHRRRAHAPGSIWHYLRARLALALGLDARETRRVADLLLRLPGRLEDGGERVDLRLPLDRLPLAVRLAGLDRDPGWIPAAGADFRFHFH